MSCSKNIFDDNLIKKVAKLANLQVDNEEIADLADRFNKTLEHIENLNKLNLEGIKPTYHTVNLQNVYFEDGVENEKGLTPEEATQNANKKRNNKFILERVL